MHGPQNFQAIAAIDRLQTLAEASDANRKRGSEELFTLDDEVLLMDRFVCDGEGSTRSRVRNAEGKC